MKKTLFFALVLVCKFTMAQVPTDGLVGSWLFNNGSVESNVTVSGATLTTDRFGNANSAYSFDGSEDYIQISDASGLNNNNFTYSIWVYVIALPGANLPEPSYCIFEAGSSANGYGLVSSINNNYIGTYGFRVTNGNINGSVKSQGDQTGELPLINTWYNLTITRDNANANVYINGTLKTTFSVSGTPYYSGSAISIFLGRRMGNFHFFNGKLDDLRIYNRALTSQEISALSETSEQSSASLWKQSGNNIYFDGTGNVGIGANTGNAPTKLTVNGTILATEVKVKSDVSTYPDFVFKPNYKLRTLTEIEQYISQYGHLPEIPGVADVQEGVNIGEMNVKLLQKIEELTLYSIEQNKSLEELKQIVKTQSQQIEKLKSGTK